jgi:hypothetical protein
MKIAAITVTYNDEYKFKEWVNYYQLYKGELYKHIIADNGSMPRYMRMIEGSFADSHIMKRTVNGGSTSAYNDGIRFALSDPEIDAIMLIGNDIRIEHGGVTKLYKFLMSNTRYGMVAPVLLAKDSEIIDDFGCEILKTLHMKPYDIGRRFADVETKDRIVASVTGGMNIAKRSFYEKIGLQDEKLFMYSDEVDMALRAKKAGFKIAATKEVKSWHQHINSNPGHDRAFYTFYLTGRNKMYLARKHFGTIRVFYVLVHLLWRIASKLALSLFDRTGRKQQLYFFRGVINGLFNNMEIKSFVINNE